VHALARRLTANADHPTPLASRRPKGSLRTASPAPTAREQTAAAARAGSRPCRRPDRPRMPFPDVTGSSPAQMNRHGSRRSIGRDAKLVGGLGRSAVSGSPYGTHSPLRSRSFAGVPSGSSQTLARDDQREPQRALRRRLVHLGGAGPPARREPNLPPRGDRRSSGAGVARAPAETLGSRRKQKRSMSRVEQVSAQTRATARCGFTAGAARAGSLRSRPFHARGSAAHPGLAGWHAPPPRRPASRTPVRSLGRGSSGLPPPSPGP
jgi:hypothetical protein